jgi:hypothetical protein
MRFVATLFGIFYFFRHPVAKEIGAKIILGHAYHNLGILHKTKGRRDQARDSFLEANELPRRRAARYHKEFLLTPMQSIEEFF